MLKSNSTQLKMGTILSYLQMALSIISGLIYTPWLIRLLGQSEYGLYNTVGSTIATMSVISLGFNHSYIRYFSRYKKENNEEKLSRLNGLFLSIFTFFGIIALVIGLYLSQNLKLIFGEGLTFQEYEKARVLMFLLSLNLAISFPMTVFSCIITAHEKFIVLKLLGILKTVAVPFVSLPFLLLGYGSIAKVAVTVIIAWAIDAVYLFYVLAILKTQFRVGEIEKGLGRELAFYTLFIAMEIIVDQINWNVDKMVLARYRGTSEVAIYSVGYTVYTYYQLFSLSISGVFTPRIHAIVNKTTDNVKERKRQLTELFVRVGRLQFLLLTLLGSGVIFFGEFFIVKIWAGEGYDRSYYVALLFVVSSSILLIQNLGIEIQRAQNKHQFRCILYVFMALMNLAISILLCQKYGATGCAFGTAISLVVADGIVMNVFYHKKCNLDIFCFWKNILKILLALSPTLLVGYLFGKFIDINSIFTFFVSIFAYTLIYSVNAWTCCLNESEKLLIISPLKKIRNRICKKSFNK